MRFAWALSGSDGALATEAALAEELGFDAVWYHGDGPDRLEPAAVAAHLAGATTGVRIGITAAVGDEHPLELAEQVAVADLAVNGRIVLAVRPRSGTEGRLGEVLDLLLDSFGARPFRHDGPVWPTPANREGNVFNVERRVRVMPPPAQIELPVWVAGAAGRDAAAERGLGVLVDAAEDLADVAGWWGGVRSTSPSRAKRMRLARRWQPAISDERLDAGLAVDELRRTEGDDFGVDLVVVDPSPRVGDRSALMSDIMRRVRPRLQLDRYPPGLEEHWADEPSPNGGTVHG